MTPFYKNSGPVCQDVRRLLSEYTDNALSARQAWEVEKHLAGCGECAVQAREMQATVQLLRTAPRLDTSDHFMAALHERLDTVSPTAMSGGSFWHGMRGWLSGACDSVSRHRVPVMSLGLAATALALLVTVNRPHDTLAGAALTAPASDGVHVSVAASANSPFSDPAADNLEFRSVAQAPRPAKSF